MVGAFTGVDINIHINNYIFFDSLFYPTFF